MMVASALSLSISFFEALSAWRSVSVPARFGNGYAQISQRKPIIRTHFLSEKGSDYMDVVRVWGLEPQRVAAREPKSRMSANSIIPAQERRESPPPLCRPTKPRWQNSRPASPPGAAVPPNRPPSAAALPSAACRCSYSPWRIHVPRRRG